MSRTSAPLEAERATDATRVPQPLQAGQDAAMAIGFAHRGARLEHPDNTLEGFARALELGANGLESDAWVTADGVAVLDHDGVARRGLRRVPISSIQRSALPGHVPTLSQLYGLPGIDGTHVSLDVKDAAALASILEAAAGQLPRLWLCHPDAGTLARWRERVGEARLVHSTGRRAIVGGFDEHCRRLAGDGVDAVNLRATEWDAAALDACHAAGLAAFGWDAQSDSSLSKLLELGVDGLYSDHVATMVRLIRSKRS